MFVTLTLGSYGRIVPGAGTPANPSAYDYRRAAVEALHFPRLFDRWMQNLRRCAGYRVQYFGAIEPQRRLAPHLHLAVRGAIPRQVIRTVTKATYLQLWWPSFEVPVYTDAESMPAWNPATGRVEDSKGVALTSWEEALDADPEAEPAVVMRFGSQVDIQGVIAPSRDADRAIRYLTKYLTKAVAETYTDPDGEVVDAGYEAHIDRLHCEVLWLPCSPECSNWIRYGIAPKNPGPGLIPGMCPNKAHDRENLGLGGRRVQVSRAWSGKTLAEHKADRATVVREVLAAAGVEAPATDRMSADVLADDGLPRYVWEPVPTDQAAYATTVLLSIAQANGGGPSTSTPRHCSPTGRAPAPATRGLWTTVRQPLARGLTIDSRPRSPDWPSRVSAANHVVTRSALDGQADDRTINRREAAGPQPRHEGKPMRDNR